MRISDWSSDVCSSDLSSMMERAFASRVSGMAVGTSNVGAPMSGMTSGNQSSIAFSAGGATVQADPTTNTLIISAADPLYRSLREVIDLLDQRRAQVLIESLRSEEHTSELQSLMRISYAVFCLKKQKTSTKPSY